MRSYLADLSRRLNAVFAEQAAMPKTTSDRNLPACPQTTIGPDCPQTTIGPDCPQTTIGPDCPQTTIGPSAAYKPTHGGYPSVGARA